MEDEKIRQGATWEHTLTETDLTADTATRTAKDESGTDVPELGATASFTTVDGVRVATLSSEADIELGDYSFGFTVEYSDGYIAKFPEAGDDCDDEEGCELPILTVCEASDETETS